MADVRKGRISICLSVSHNSIPYVNLFVKYDNNGCPAALLSVSMLRSGHAMGAPCRGGLWVDTKTSFVHRVGFSECETCNGVSMATSPT